MKYAVSFIMTETGERAWLERDNLAEARELALRQAEDPTRREITIWQAIERTAHTVVPFADDAE